MRLNKTDDPRDNLQRATKRELIDFAHAKGLTEVHEGMPVDSLPHEGKQGIRELLRSKGLSRIPVPPRPLGAKIPLRTHALHPSQPAKPVQSATADEWAEFQQFKAWKAAQTPKAVVPVADMSMGELRAACKANGVAISRRDNMELLREKLRVKLGENPSQ